MELIGIKRLRTHWLTAALILLPALRASAAGSGFYLHPHDTVVFYGDSITDQRFYTLFTELYVVTRYPDLDVNFVHSGWGGDRVSGGGGGPVDVRLPRDVFAYKPNVVTIMLGMNDGKYVHHQPADDEVFYNGYRHILDELKSGAPGLRITAIAPSPYDDVTRPPFPELPGGYNAVLVQYGNWIRKQCAEQHLDYADLNKGVVEMLQKANQDNSALSQKIIPDRVHPGPSGHLIMAEQLLKAWNARPLVSSVTIDAGRGTVTSEEFAKVTGVSREKGLAWNELEEALPLPFADLIAADRDHLMPLTIQSSDVTKALNQEMLQVKGLKTGKYALQIDGTGVGVFSSEELKEGVNLATLETPMSKQAMAVRDLTQKHLDVHQARWRTVQVPLQDMPGADLAPALAALDKVEAEIVARQRETAHPKQHAFELIPQA